MSQNRHRTQINIMLQRMFTKRENRTKQNISHKIIFSLGTSLQIFTSEELLLIIPNEVGKTITNKRFQQTEEYSITHCGK